MNTYISIKKIIGVLFLSLLVVLSLFTHTYAATSTKTEGLSVSGSGYTWAMARLVVDYNTSTLKITGANVEKVYTFPGASVTRRVTALKDYDATGKLTATVGSTTKSDTVTIHTK